MTQQYDYDLVVIGAGPGGYVASIRASQLGLKVAVIEKDKPGGVCLNVGCIPSKSLIHQAELFRSIGDLEKLDVQVDTSNFDYSKVYNKSRKAADTLSKGVQYLLKKNKIDLIIGEGIITGEREVSLSDGKKVTGNNILIATGSRPKELPGFPFDEGDRMSSSSEGQDVREQGEVVLSSTGALMLQKLPKILLILGAGAIGVEFAHIMNAFGVEVHLVEALDRILPLEDEEVVEVLNRSFKKRGIQISTGTKALSMTKENNMAQIILEKDGSKSELEVDQILVAVGRVPNTTNIGLENVGLKVERGFIPVRDYYQTDVSGIYAVGDAIDSPLLAHVASKEGETAVERMAGLNPKPKLDILAIPSGIYCEPQIASFGYTEGMLKEKGIPYKKAIFPYRGAAKSVTIERSEGLVKIIYAPDTKEILGAHLVGAEATELIHELLLAKTAELLPADISNMIHAHPTLSEAVLEAIRVIENTVIHI